MRALVALLLLGCATIDDQADPFDAARDAWPYFIPAVVEQRAPYARPTSDEEIATDFAAALGGDVPPPRRRGQTQLRAGIIAALRIAPMLDGFAERPFSVRQELVIDKGNLVWSRLVLDDDFVAGLIVDVLSSRAPVAARPGVVGLHGHHEDGAAFLESYLGVELARRGVIVAAPHFRHMGCGHDERNQSIYLLRDGFTLMGQRVYEALLTMKLLRSLDGVDPTRIGLAGHSGGSSTAILLVRLSDWPAAVLTDYQVDYRNTCDGQLHCETLPALLPFAGDVNDVSTLPIPHLRIDYGYRVRAQRAAALDFFSAHLS